MTASTAPIRTVTSADTGRNGRGITAGRVRSGRVANQPAFDLTTRVGPATRSGCSAVTPRRLPATASGTDFPGRGTKNVLTPRHRFPGRATDFRARTKGILGHRHRRSDHRTCQRPGCRTPRSSGTPAIGTVGAWSPMTPSAPIPGTAGRRPQHRRRPAYGRQRTGPVMLPGLPGRPPHAPASDDLLSSVFGWDDRRSFGRCLRAHPLRTAHLHYRQALRSRGGAESPR